MGPSCRRPIERIQETCRDARAAQGPSPFLLERRRTRSRPDPPVRLWFDEANQSGMPESNAMTLATATPDGRPSARMVLLRGADARGFSSSPITRAEKPASSTPTPSRRSSFSGTTSSGKCGSRAASSGSRARVRPVLPKPAQPAPDRRLGLAPEPGRRRTRNPRSLVRRIRERAPR